MATTAKISTEMSWRRMNATHEFVQPGEGWQARHVQQFIDHGADHFHVSAAIMARSC